MLELNKELFFKAVIHFSHFVSSQVSQNWKEHKDLLLHHFKVRLCFFSLSNKKKTNECKTLAIRNNKKQNKSIKLLIENLRLFFVVVINSTKEKNLIQVNNELNKHQILLDGFRVFFFFFFFFFISSINEKSNKKKKII